MKTTTAHEGIHTSVVVATGYDLSIRLYFDQTPNEPVGALGASPDDTGVYAFLDGARRAATATHHDEGVPLTALIQGF